VVFAFLACGLWSRLCVLLNFVRTCTTTMHARAQMRPHTFVHTDLR
jgi:hypothetical protein